MSAISWLDSTMANDSSPNLFHHRKRTASMKGTSSEGNPLQALRARAEHVLQQSNSEVRDAPSDPMLHELRLHELELRMQNEALRELQVEVTITRERYRDLFQNAPVAYLLI